MSNTRVMCDEEPKSVDKVEEDLIIRETIEQLQKKIFDEPDEKTFVPMIIAMKGDAYTGKTTCADAITKSLKCSVVSFDDILDSLSPSSPTSPEEGQRLRDVAFSVVVRVAKQQLMILRTVVIDSPLSDPVHLQRLLQILDLFNCCFAIVECRPAVKYAWKMRFEKRDRRETDKYWFKAKEWTDVEETSSVEWNQCLPDKVSRLIVDTTGYGDLPNLGPATVDMVYCVKGHLLHFEEWQPDNPIHSAFTFLNNTKNKVQPQDECGDGRHMLELDLQEAASLYLVCGSCQGPISYPKPAYICKRCNKLALHKSCAELRDFHKKFAESALSGDACGSEKHSTCQKLSTTEAIEGLWEVHLTMRTLPTILHHEGSPSRSVCFWITSPANPRKFQCAACKLPGDLAGYTCLKSKFRFNLHVWCAFFPRHGTNLHGGYQHIMRLGFGTHVIQEDYLCDVCGEFRDPSAWYYYCLSDDCVFVSHLHCVYRPEDL